MTNHKAKGTRRELQVVEWYKEQGWFAFRSPASLGACDVIALKKWKMPQLVEVKSTTRSPWVSFGPSARERLRLLAWEAGGVPLLAWWPAHKPLVFFPAEEWPS